MTASVGSSPPVPTNQLTGERAQHSCSISSFQISICYLREDVNNGGSLIGSGEGVGLLTCHTLDLKCKSRSLDTKPRTLN